MEGTESTGEEGPRGGQGRGRSGLGREAVRVAETGEEGEVGAGTSLPRLSSDEGEQVGQGVVGAVDPFGVVGAAGGGGSRILRSPRRSADAGNGGLRSPRRSRIIYGAPPTQTFTGRSSYPTSSFVDTENGLRRVHWERGEPRPPSPPSPYIVVRPQAAV